jgi:transcription termination factor Rho
MNIVELESKSLDELQEMAKDLEISGYTRLRKSDLIFRLLQAQSEQQGFIFGKGVLEITEDGIGRRHLRLSVPDPPVRPAHGRHGYRPDASPEGEREVLQPS